MSEIIGNQFTDETRESTLAEQKECVFVDSALRILYVSAVKVFRANIPDMMFVLHIDRHC